MSKYLALEQSQTKLSEILIFVQLLRSKYWTYRSKVFLFVFFFHSVSNFLFQLASGEVLLTTLTSTIVGEHRRVIYNYPGPKNEQCHTQTVKLGLSSATAIFISGV